MITVMDMTTGNVTLDATVSSNRKAIPMGDAMHEYPALALHEVEVTAPSHRTGMPPELANRTVAAFLAEFDCS